MVTSNVIHINFDGNCPYTNIKVKLFRVIANNKLPLEPHSNDICITVAKTLCLYMGFKSYFPQKTSSNNESIYNFSLVAALYYGYVPQ